MTITEYPFTIEKRLIKGGTFKTGSEPWDVGYVNDETRFFTIPEKVGSFDGTAQGYGYKTAQALYKAYYFSANRKKIIKNANNRKQEVQKFLTEYPKIKDKVKEYFSEDSLLDMAKDSENPNYKDFCNYCESELPADFTSEMYKKLQKEYC